MSNKSSILFFSAVFILFGWTAKAQKTALVYAEELFDKGSIDSALFHFEVAIGQDPANVELQKKVADLCRYTNRPSKANAIYEQLITSPNTDYLTWYQYAYTLRMDGNYDKSREVLMKLKSHPDVVGDGGIIQLIENTIDACDFAKNNKSKTSIYIGIANEKAANSAFADFAPVYSGNQVYFASNRIVNGLEGNAANQSDINSDYIYVATRKQDKDLIELRLLHDLKSADFASGAADLAPFCFSADGKTMFSSYNTFSAGLRHPFQPSGGSILDLNYAQITNKTAFPKLKPIEFANATKIQQSGFPCLSPDGKTLYFAAAGTGLGVNYGGFDIYISFLENGVWSTPQNLGPNVNTPHNEISPYISEDGVLYFSSDGHKGFGGFDIFCAERIGGTWRALHNLGNGINSSSDDLYFVHDIVNEISYFSSNRAGGAGDYDIYSAKRMDSKLSLLPKVYEEEANYVISTPTEEKVLPPFKDSPSPKGDDLASNPEEIFIGNVEGINGATPRGTNPNAATDNKKGLPPTSSKTTTTTTKPVADNKGATDNRLPCADNAYIGSISDVMTKKRLEDVWVYVKNSKTGEERKVKTSKYGEYAIVLDAQTQYEIRCSRQGYENIIFDIFTADGERRTLLGEKTMTAAATADISEEMANNGFAARGGAAPAKMNSENFLRGPQSNKATPSVGFQIQIGAFKDLSSELQKEFASLANVISEPLKTGDAKVYRLGVFADEAHAKETLAKVQKMKGFEKSYLKTIDLESRTTSDRMNSELMLVYPKTAKKEEVAIVKKTEQPIKKAEEPLVKINNDPTLNIELEDPKQPVKGNVKETPKENTTTKTEILTIKENPRSSYADNPVEKNTASLVSNKPLEYKIQIGAYKDPAKAKFADLSNVGLLEKTLNKDNGLTYFYLTGYTNLDDARKAKSRAEQKGVSTPFIVAFKNGQKVAVSEAEN